jgi:hypothetical protein
MDAAGVVALGRLALSTGDGRLIRQTGLMAEAMLTESTPGVRRHGAWLLSLRATADGDAGRAHRWLCALGERERKQLLPRLWPDLADEVRVVRMAVAVGDDELAESAVATANRRAELSPDVPSLAAIAVHASVCATTMSKAVARGESVQAGAAAGGAGIGLEDLG